ncbi:DUF5063 domain-containing protein [Saccharicrinis aurantiacus]|uniref:DUF5063 domain-containing protein n=1 Tax=Saccharicrinis aurantiacus TaxID=1849719 RepID=UPI002493B2D0|nr:DUF5063 domain-containing protein [Saccharicrinis aurantiacus]
MEEGLDHVVYTKNVLEFVTVGNEFCQQLEHSAEATSAELVYVMVRILPLLYVKSLTLPKVDYELEEQIEKYISEEDYIRMNHSLLGTLGANDDYLEVFVPDNEYEEQEVASSISENLTDIYQEVKDFLFSYRIGQTEIMNDALVDLVNNFELHWGQKLVNVLRACHSLVYGGKNLEDELGGNELGDNPEGNSGWFDNFQQQWQD